MKIFRTIRNIMRYSLNIPIYILSKLVKQNKNVWIFGAWFGRKYTDNSKYLFEYVNKNCPKIKAIWLSRDDATIKQIRKKGYSAYKAYGFWGYFYSLISKYAFVSTGPSDINIFPTANMKIVNLWHGVPLKKVVMDDVITGTRHKETSLYYKLKDFFFPFARDNYFSTIATSEEIRKIYSSAFRGVTKQVDVIGQTRCDSFYLPVEQTPFTKKLKKLKNEEGKKLIIYMPTHRQEGKINFSDFIINELENFNKKMQEMNAVLLVKLHFYHQNDINAIGKEYSNIIFLKDKDIEQDIYSILPLTDILITDYSSIYFDYLHLDKPIIFYPFDKEDYLKNDRAFYFDYDKVTPGEKAYNWAELYDKIENTLAVDNYKEARQEINNMFNLYQDGKNCERIVEWVRNLENE